MKAWLAREVKGQAERNDFYCLAFGKRPSRDRYGCWPGKGVTAFCPRLWVRAGGMKLEPGEGPVHVEVSVVCKMVKGGKC